MQISEPELRSMIREAIERYGGPGHDGAEGAQAPAHAAKAISVNASHGLFPIAAGWDGECIIEPSVRCNHCGYCKSLGH